MDGDWTSPDGMASVLLGDVFARLAGLPAGSVHTVVTSPPYWGLRDYGVAGQLGSEQTLDEYLARMVAVFLEVRRVLRDDGTLWLNMGDCYGDGSRDRKSGRRDRATCNQHGSDRRAEPGNQLLQPHRLAMALQADGWTLRSTVIWAKRSPMPESLAGVRWVRCRVNVANGSVARIGDPSDTVNRNFSDFAPSDFSRPESLAKWRDCPGCPKCEPNGGYVLRRGAWRPTTAHEYVFLLTKGMDYFCDGERAKEAATSTNGGACVGKRGQNRNEKSAEDNARIRSGSRNPRSVWTLSSEPFKGAHFATFPPTLVYRCLLAATSSAGCCQECGAPLAPMVSSERVATRPGLASKVYVDGPPVASESPNRRHNGDVCGNRDPARHTTTTAVHGYRPTCGCPAAEPVPMTVLDPFSGSGTTGQVARSMGLRYVGIELNPSYLEMSKVRIETPWKPKAERRPGAKRRRKHRRQIELFT